MNQTERVFRLVRILEDAALPVPQADLLVQLEASRATFKRDLAYLREQLNIPIAWQPAQGAIRGGYRLEAPHSKTLRGVWFNPSEILALLTMQQLAAAMEPGLLAPHTAGLMARLQLMLGSASDAPDEVQRRVRVLHSAHRRITPPCFQDVAHATLKRRVLHFDYFTRSRGETSRRTVSPQQLLHYRENWYLLAWCHHNQDLRLFALDAISTVNVDAANAREVPERTLRSRVGDGFGIFSGTQTREAVLQFAPSVAAWIAQEQWHPQQVLEQQADGGLIMRLPFGEHRELLMEILRHGSEVQVLAPPELRAAVLTALQAALAQYGEAAGTTAPSAFLPDDCQKLP